MPPDETRRVSAARHWLGDLAGIKLRQPRFYGYPVSVSVSESMEKFGAAFTKTGHEGELAFMEAKTFLQLCRWGLRTFDFPHEHEMYSDECRICGVKADELKDG